MERAKPIAVLGAGVLLMLGLLYWLFFSSPARYPVVTATLLGYTNSTPGSVTAVFGITNRAGVPVKLLAGCGIQVEASTRALNAGFSETILGSGKGLITAISFQAPPRRWRARWRFVRNTLHERLLTLRDDYNWPVARGSHVIYAADSQWLPSPVE